MPNSTGKRIRFFQGGRDGSKTILYPVSLLNPELFHLHFAMSLKITGFQGFFLYTVDSIRAMWYDVADVILKEG